MKFFKEAVLLVMIDYLSIFRAKPSTKRPKVVTSLKLVKNSLVTPKQHTTLVPKIVTFRPTGVTIY